MNIYVCVFTEVQHEQQIQHHTSHRKMEQLTAEVTLRESSFDGELDGQNSNPSGAILSLTLGNHYQNLLQIDLTN